MSMAANDQYVDNVYGDEELVAQVTTEAPVEPSQPAQGPTSDKEHALQAMGSIGPPVSGAAQPQRAVGLVALPNAGGSIAPFVLAGIGAVAGGMYAGLWGAAAGALGVGAVLNANRWRHSPQGPARSQSGLFALATAGAAVYAGWKAYQNKFGGPTDEDETTETEPDVVEVAANSKHATKPVPRPWLRPKNIVRK